MCSHPVALSSILRSRLIPRIAVEGVVGSVSEKELSDLLAAFKKLQVRLPRQTWTHVGSLMFEFQTNGVK